MVMEKLLLVSSEVIRIVHLVAVLLVYGTTADILVHVSIEIKEKKLLEAKYCGFDHPVSLHGSKNSILEHPNPNLAF